jgi:hypothetical protein
MRKSVKGGGVSLVRQKDEFIYNKWQQTDIIKCIYASS